MRPRINLLDIHIPDMEPEITQDDASIAIEAAPATPPQPTQHPTKPPRKVVPMTEKRLAHLRQQNERRSAEAKIRHLERKTATKAERERATYDQLHAKYGAPPAPPPPSIAAEEPVETYAEPPRRPALRYAPMPMINFV